MKRLILLLCLTVPLVSQAQIRVFVTYTGTYSSTTTYNQNDIALVSSIYYISLIADNLGNTPASSPSAWQVFGGGGTSVTFSGDLSGSPTAQQVVGLKNVPFCTGFSPTNGQVLEYTTGGTPNPCYSAGASGGFSPGTDLSGSSTSQQVIGIEGHTLPTLAVGYPNWTGAVWAYSTPGETTVGTQNTPQAANGSGGNQVFSATASNPLVLPATGGAVNPVPGTTLSTAGWTPVGGSLVPWTGVEGNGDSILSNYGLSGCTVIGGTCYLNLIASDMGLTYGAITNRAVSGNMAADVAMIIAANDNYAANSSIAEILQISSDNAEQFGNGGWPGTYEAVEAQNLIYSMTWLAIGSGNKTVPTPATNFTTDTSTYGSTTNPVVVSTTSTSVQTCTYTIPSGVPASGVTPFWAYGTTDTVSSTSALGSFKATDSYQGTTYVHWLNNFTNPITSTHNGQTQGRGVVFFNDLIHTTAGTYTLTATVTSATLSSNPVILGACGVTGIYGTNTPVYAVEQHRLLFDTSAALTQSGVNFETAVVASLPRELGIQLVTPRNAVYGTLAEMNTNATYQLHHMIGVGVTEWVNAVFSPVASPAVPLSFDPNTFLWLRKPTMASTGDHIFPSDEVVGYGSTSVSGSIYWPFMGITANSGTGSLHKIGIHNFTSGTALPYASGPGASIQGTMVGGYSYPGHYFEACNFDQLSQAAQWIPCGGSLDPMQFTQAAQVKSTGSTYTATCTDQHIIVTVASAYIITLPVGCFDHGWLIEEQNGSHNITISATSGSANGAVLYPGQAQYFWANDTSGSVNAGPKFDNGKYSIPPEAVGTQTISGCSLTSAVGGSWAGAFAAGTTGTCTVTITPGITAPNGWFCRANDLTTTTDTLPQTASSTTTCTLAGTTVSGDAINWQATAY